MRKLIYPAVLFFLLILNGSFISKDAAGRGLSIIINKAKYELSVYDDDGWLITYPVVFGSNDLGDKLAAGDRKTPEGTFTIVSKRVHEKWDRMMMLDYPTLEDYAKFNERKAKGIIPQFAKIGGGIGIHGTWPHEDFSFNRYNNWTLGCVSLRNQDVEELFKMVPVGTKVTIMK